MIFGSKLLSEIMCTLQYNYNAPVVTADVSNSVPCSVLGEAKQ